MEVSILSLVKEAINNVIKKLIKPCINLSSEYLIIETSYLPIKELTCAIIDNPEKEHKKLIIASFIGIVREELAIKLQPLVISMLPKKQAYRESFGKLNKASRL